MGPTGPFQPPWVALNRVDARGLVLDGLTILCWIGVYRAASHRRKVSIPWLACGGALLILAILPEVIASPSYAFRQFFSQLAFWFGPTFPAAATLLAVGGLSNVLSSRRFLGSD
jgi:hypothetical protein